MSHAKFEQNRTVRFRVVNIRHILLQVHTVPHEIVTIETFFSKFSLCAVRKLDIFSERNVFRKHKICEKFLNARCKKSVHIEA